MLFAAFIKQLTFKHFALTPFWTSSWIYLVLCAFILEFTLHWHMVEDTLTLSAQGQVVLHDSKIDINYEWIVDKRARMSGNFQIPLDFFPSHHSFTSLWLPFFSPPPRPHPLPWQRHTDVEETGEEAWTKRTRATERRTPAEPKRWLTRRTFSHRWLAINEVSKRGRKKKHCPVLETSQSQN